MLKGALLATIILALATAGAVVAYVKVTGLSARAMPGPIERTVSRRLRAWAVPAADRARINPIPRDEASITSGMAHFADHCASCHANDGSGDTEMGRGLFPPAPDMRAVGTQSLSDAELFYVIEHGVRFTGMPAWGTGTAAGEADSWRLVSFIRHLPRITEAEIDEMTGMNPGSPAEVRADIAAERFLAGEDVSPPRPQPGAGQ